MNFILTSITKSVALLALMATAIVIIIDYEKLSDLNQRSTLKPGSFQSLSAALQKDLRDLQNLTSDNRMVNETQQKVRILCWIMTHRGNHEAKAQHVKSTWGKRCNILYFVSTLSDPELPAIAYMGQESRSILWGKTKLGFQFAYHKHFNDADWFLKADDDTYVVMENLRYFLQQKNTSDPQWFGFHFRKKMRQGFMGGGSGYILSKTALERFVTALNDTSDENCLASEDNGPEDVEIGKCLQNVNVTIGETRDNLGRLRFIPVVPDDIMVPNATTNFWFWNYLSDYSEHGERCCSNSTISFHYITPSQMHVLEFLIYKFKVFGFDFQ